MIFARSRFLGFVALALATACTKVREQPPAPVIAPAPAVTKLPAKAAERRTQRSAWPSARSGPAAAGGPSAWAAARAAGATDPAPAVPTAPDREKLQKILDTALPTLTPCWSGETALSTAIAFEATGAGKAENIRMPGASAASARCVAERLRGLSLPVHAGPVVSIQIPVTVSSTTTMRPVGAAQGTSTARAEAAPAAPPKLFVNP